MEIKQLDAQYFYDYDLDIVNIKIKREYEYEESLDLDTGVFLDFDDNYFPVFLEIVSASKRLNVNKEFLDNPGGEVKIFIMADLIRLDVTFRNLDNECMLRYANKHDENLKIPDLETDIALV